MINFLIFDFTNSMVVVFKKITIGSLKVTFFLQHSILNVLIFPLKSEIPYIRCKTLSKVCIRELQKLIFRFI